MKTKLLILQLMMILISPMILSACGETFGGDPGIFWDDLLGKKEPEFKDPGGNPDPQPESSDADFETEVTLPENLIAFEDKRGLGWKVKNITNQTSGPVKILYELMQLDRTCGSSNSGGYGGAIIGANEISVNSNVGSTTVHPLAVSGAYSYMCASRWALGVCASYTERYYHDAKAEQEKNGTNNCDYKEFEIVNTDIPNEAPVVDFDYTCSGLTCTFDSTESYDDMAIFHIGWRFNADGARPAPHAGYTMNEEYTFAEEGTHEVCFWATDQYRLYNIVCKEITVTE